MHESEKWKWGRSVVSDSSRPHGLQPTRLLRPWDFPGKSTGVGCHCLLPTLNLDAHIWGFLFGVFLRFWGYMWVRHWCWPLVIVTCSPKFLLGCPLLSHQRLSKVSASLDRELRESLGATAPVISGLPFLLGACCASGGSVGTRPSRTRLTPPPQSWEILSLLLSPTLFFYIKCLFASNFFQVPLLLSARPWFSSTASVNPLSPLSLPRTTYRHISPGAMECRTFFHLNGLGRRAANVQWGKKEKI